jgi:hypothetical protein
MKKALVIVGLLLMVCVNGFADGVYVQDVVFEDAKLCIQEMWSEVSYNGRVVNSQYLRVINKTNYEIEVKLSFRINVVDLAGRGQGNRTKDFNGETIKIKPRGTQLVSAYEYGNALGYPSPPDKTFFTSLIELVHYRVFEKSYEIR